MSALRSALLAVLFTMTALPGWGQGVSSLAGPGGANPVTISGALRPTNARAGEGAQVVITVKIDPPYHLYSLTEPEGGSVRTTLNLASGGPIATVDKPVQPAYTSVFNPAFKITDQTFEKEVSFGIPVTLKPGISGAQQASASIHYQVCDEHRCLIPKTVQVPITFTVVSGAARPDHNAAVTDVPPQTVAQGGTATDSQGAAQTTGTTITASTSTTSGAPAAPSDDTSQRIQKAQGAGLLSFIGLAFGAGFLALSTPCVFPMIPITVSFFAKRRQKGGQGLRDALAYCLGIICTFTVLGVAAAAIFKASGIRVFANNPWVNLAFAILFVALGINLMGGFEIKAPTGLANRAQAGIQRGGLIGPFLMGLTFTLTSFTCTVAFVGTLLAAAAQGSLFYPILGMLAFSTAFSLPFFLLALFPQYLARLPKSGSWLVTVKATMGFVELLAAVKFLSNADLVWSLGWLTRPVFLAVWAGIAAVGGLYLLGALRLPHDDGTKIGWTRRGLGALTALLAVLFLAGINGASLGWAANYLPPDPYPGREGGKESGLPWLQSYAQAQTQSQQENKPIFFDFTGVNCTNCRDMELNVFPHADVQGELSHFVLVKLFTDRDRDDDRRNEALMEKLTHSASLPTYAVMKPDGTVTQVLQDRRNPAEFIAFLRKGRE